MPPLVVTLQAFLFDWRGLHAGARFRYVAPRPLAFGATSSPQAVLDLTCGFRFGWGQIDLTLDNATDAAWKEGEFNFASHWDRTQPKSVIPQLQFAAGPPITLRGGFTARF